MSKTFLEALTSVGKNLQSGVDKLNITKGDWINVKEAGAKGDGVTDDTNIIKDLATKYSTLLFESGTYIVSELNIDGVSFISNSRATIKTTGTNTTRNAIEAAGSYNFIGIDFIQDGTSPLFGLKGSHDAIIKDCTFTVPETCTSTNGYVDVYTNNQNILFENCEFHMHIAPSGAVWVREGSTTGVTKNIIFNKCYFDHKGRDESIAVWSWFGRVENVFIDNCRFELAYNGERKHVISLGSGDEGLEGENGNQITGNIYVRNCNFSCMSLLSIAKSSGNNGFIDNCNFYCNDYEYGYAFKNIDVRNCRLFDFRGKVCSTGSPVLRNCTITGKDFSIGGFLYAYNCTFETTESNSKTFIEYGSHFEKCNFKLYTGLFINIYTSNIKAQLLDCVLDIVEATKLINVSANLSGISIMMLRCFLPNLSIYVGTADSGCIVGCICESTPTSTNLTCSDNIVCAWR